MKSRFKMAINESHSKSQLLNFAQDSYFERTSRPIYAVVFLLPFIALYEIGTFLINTTTLSQYQGRVVAFIWLGNFLEYLGFGERFTWVAPPLAVIVILLSLQLTSRKRWGFRFTEFVPMAIECILLAIPLIVLSLLLNSPANPRNSAALPSETGIQICAEQLPNRPAPPADTQPYTQAGGDIETEKRSLMADIVTSIGAGIYEELVFRLILIVFLIFFFQDVVKLGRNNSIVLSVIISAALFSAHHHIFLLNGQLTSNGDFNITEFGFRTIAGVYFSVLFAARGFAITAGTHIFYDIIATITNTFFFQQ